MTDLRWQLSGKNSSHWSSERISRTGMTTLHMTSEFSLWAHFYRLKLGAQVLDCRSRVDIFRTSGGKTPESKSIVAAIPDLVFVLLNPGSCRPGDMDDVFPLYKPDEMSDFGQLSRVTPDRTQIQLMRLLDMLELNHGRLLNLSDIRESCSLRFTKTLRSLKSRHRENAHSIFGKPRKGIFRACLDSRLGVAVVGWGAHCVCPELANRCLEELARQGIRIVGKAHPCNRNGYYHPLARHQVARDRWLSEIACQLP